MGVVLKKLRIRRVLSRKIGNLHRNNVRSWRKQLKPIKQRSFTRKRKCTSSRCGDLLLLLVYFTCFGSILNIIRRFVSNKVLREQRKPRNDVYSWRHADHGRLVMYFRSGASPWGNFRFPHQVNCMFQSLSQVLLSVCQSCGTIWRVPSNMIQREELKPRNHICILRRAYNYGHHGWRAVIQFLNAPSINLSGLVDLHFGFSPFKFLLSECWNCGTIWRVLLNKICRVLSNKIQMEELECGDHIYTWRHAYSYAHHGIYVGDGMVIHYTRGGGLDRIIFSLSPSHHSNGTNPISSDQSRLDRVICSSIDDFLSGGELYCFEYGVNLALFIAKTRGGTCTLACSDPPNDVLDRAYSLLENGFGKYHLFGNNCEDFAIYCKTGIHLVDNNFSIGRSGQAASFLVAISAFISSTIALFVDNMYSVGRTRQAASLLVGISAFLSSTIRCPTVRIISQHFMGRRGQTPSFLVYISAFVSSTIRSPTVIITGQHFIVGYSIYSACRWASDIGIRRNASKAANSRLAEEGSSGYGVSIKFNSAFLKGLAWDILVFATWWICCYELELTTEITSFQLGWIILTSTVWRVLFVPVDRAEKVNKSSYCNSDLSIDLRIRFISVKTVWLWLLNVLPNKAACWCLITLVSLLFWMLFYIVL
nr:uncharacterized protein LOC107415516 isoform X2 [Ziziphus jujuba var. spinosa]